MRGWWKGLGFLLLLGLLAACGTGGGAADGCQPAHFDSGCTFDGGATFN